MYDFIKGLLSSLLYYWEEEGVQKVSTSEMPLTLRSLFKTCLTCSPHSQFLSS